MSHTNIQPPPLTRGDATRATRRRNPGLWRMPGGMQAPRERLSVVTERTLRFDTRFPAGAHKGGGARLPTRRGARLLSRAMTVALLVLAIFVVAFLLFFEADEPYKVTLSLDNASQLVKGNQVKVGGVP